MKRLWTLLVVLPLLALCMAPALAEGAEGQDLHGLWDIPFGLTGEDYTQVLAEAKGIEVRPIPAIVPFTEVSTKYVPEAEREVHTMWGIPFELTYFGPKERSQAYSSTVMLSFDFEMIKDKAELPRMEETFCAQASVIMKEMIAQYGQPDASFLWYSVAGQECQQRLMPWTVEDKLLSDEELTPYLTDLAGAIVTDREAYMGLYDGVDVSFGFDITLFFRNIQVNACYSYGDYTLDHSTGERKFGGERSIDISYSSELCKIPKVTPGPSVLQPEEVWGPDRSGEAGTSGDSVP